MTGWSWSSSSGGRFGSTVQVHWMVAGISVRASALPAHPPCGLKYPEELSQSRIIRFARTAFHIFLIGSYQHDRGEDDAGRYTHKIFGEPKSENREQSAELGRCIRDGSKGIWTIEVTPVFWRRVISLELLAANTTLSDGPRFGVGSSSCAGREKRALAMSETPMNLDWKEAVSGRG